MSDEVMLEVEGEAVVDRKGRPVWDPVYSEFRAEQVRSRLSPAPVEGLYKTPDEMIGDLDWSKYGVGQIALVLKEANRTVKVTARRLALARARALKGSEGKSADQRDADVTLATEPEQQLADDAEIALQFAKDTARGIESSASQTQTQAGLVKSQLSLAGSGRGA
jgi:hypothetical protein